MNQLDRTEMAYELPADAAPGRQFSRAADFQAYVAPRLFAEPPLSVGEPAPFGCHTIAGLDPDPSLIARARPAAVLLPVIERENGLMVLLTERSAALSTHAGQIAFPGGRVEAGESALCAALREAKEEIGLDPELVEPLGYLQPYYSGTGFRVQPVVALVAADASFTPDPGEVARIFEIPLALALDRQRYSMGLITWQGRERAFFILDYPDAYIWGVTAGIMRSMAERV
ncbi:MutT NTP pyrophosphohydrolases including oxidative damage repair enzymes [Rhabdaerophilaceae bacterium]